MSAVVFCIGSNSIIFFTRGTLGLFNDFYIYWSAATVLNQGGNPYHRASLALVDHHAGLPGILGEGYSYPILFAQALRPLAWLNPLPAGIVFMTVSLAALGIAAALLITTAPRTSWFMSLLLGGVVGLFPPVSYGLWLGQANLLILPLLALAFRGVYPGLTLMLASGVKIYPITGLVALWDRPDRWKQMALASAAGLAILLLQWPVGLPAISNLGPDAYWSNQSINGFLSRLALVPGWIPSDAPLGAIDLGLVVVLGYFTLRLLARARFQPFTGVLALSLWFGSVAAPKNSLWNFVPLLLCLALGLQQARRHPGPAITMFLSVCLMGIQLIVWGVTLRGGAIPRSEYANPWVLWTSSLGLMAALFIGAATARLISARERV